MDEVIRFVEYVRVSGTSQAERATQRLQREALMRLRERRPGVLVPGRGPTGAFEDLGISGAAQEEDRPAWAEVMRLIRNGEVQELRVYNLDRCTRSSSPAAWGSFAADFVRSDCIIVETAGSVIDVRGHSSAEVMLLMVKAWGAGEERRRIAARFMDGRRSAAVGRDHRGAWGAVPTGYRFERGRGYVLDDRDLGGGHTVGSVIRGVFELALTLSARDVAARLSARGVPNPSGGPWSRNTITEWLRQSAYRGQWQTRLPVERDDRGRPRPAPPGAESRDDVDGPHWHYTVELPPIVAPELWDRVQRAVSARRRAQPGEVTKVEALFRHHARCGACLNPAVAHNRLSRGRRYPVYVCSQRGCELRGHGFRTQAVDALGWGVIVDRLLTDEAIREPEAEPRDDPERRELDSRDAALRAEMQGLVDLMAARGPAFQAAALSRCDAIEAALTLNARRRAELDAAVLQRQRFAELAREVGPQLERWRACLQDDMPFAARRELVQALMAGEAGWVTLTREGEAQRVEVSLDLLAARDEPACSHAGCTPSEVPKTGRSGSGHARALHVPPHAHSNTNTHGCTRDTDSPTSQTPHPGCRYERGSTPTHPR
jgi:DNA invertase Pin-like site-specific DNA recombinase